MTSSQSQDGDYFLDSTVTARLSPPGLASLSDGAYLSIGIYLSVLGLLAFVGNSVVLFVILYQKTAFQKLFNILLVNMASADLLVTITAYPMTAISSFFKRWLFGDLACEFGGFLVFMLTVVSLDTLTALAVFRYILVCKPSWHHLLRGATARPVVVFIWVHSVIWTSLPLFGWNRYTTEMFKTSCTLDWDGRSAGDVSYVVLTMLSCYLVQLAVIVFCYTCILIKTRRLTFGVRENNSQQIKLEEVLWHHKVFTEREVTKMCAVMVVAFLVCWTPYAFVSLLAMAGVHLSPQVTTLPTMCAKLSCALNPLIYAFMSSKFRQTLFALSPWGSRSQNRVATAAIEVPAGGPPKTACADPPKMREYRGDMITQGVYIGNMVVTLQEQPTVF